MPEDVGGTPFPNGNEPDDDRDHGVSDEEFASVVFDEAFVQAAAVHEPTAVERLLAAAQARAEAAEAETRRTHPRGDRHDGRRRSDGTELGHDHDDELDDTYVLGDGPGPHGPYGRQVRWHRPVAWVLALVMGIGMVALAFAAVYRSASSTTRDRIPPPASTGLEQATAAAPTATTEQSRPTASAGLNTP